MHCRGGVPGPVDVGPLRDWPGPPAAVGRALHLVGLVGAVGGAVALPPERDALSVRAFEHPLIAVA